MNLQKAVKIHASAVNMSQTSHLNELVSTSHTLASELSCFLIMYPRENNKAILKKKKSLKLKIGWISAILKYKYRQCQIASATYTTSMHHKAQMASN